MKLFNIYYGIAIFYHYFMYHVLADNKYYIVSIRRNSKDKEYDKSDEKVQQAIDDLVNDRMNDIYDVIADHQESYLTEDGQLDEKLEELEVLNQLRKRKRDIDESNGHNGKRNFKFQFLNKNRPQKHEPINLNSSPEEDIDLIPFESKLVSHICPVKNYYVVMAYLSDEIVQTIQTLPNIISCVESKKTESYKSIDLKLFEKGVKESETALKYYNEKEILEETHWKSLSVQEHEFALNLRNSHLSLLSQGRYARSATGLYDNNYYYPSSAGQGVDIFVIDGGLDTSYNEEDFDTYEGTPEERIIQCDGEIYDGQFHPAKDPKNCQIGYFMDVEHGTYVSISALGKIHGVAKKANLHMLATNYDLHDNIVALDYILNHMTNPHKTIINISRGCKDGVDDCFSQEVQDKINELVERGAILFASAGNTPKNRCKKQLFVSCQGVIPIGAINNEEIQGYDHEAMYEIANYSSYGECVELFAPGTIRVYKDDGDSYIESGTSFASPLVAGVASTIISENPIQEFNYELMKKKLIDLSLKDVIGGMEGLNTPNRLVNNGKHSVYELPKCHDPSGGYPCGDKCCTRNGYCVDPKEYNPELRPYCLLENGCHSEFGYCETKKCGPQNHHRKCPKDECCSRDGTCIEIRKDRQGLCFVENGCLKDFSQPCLSTDLEELDQYDKKYQDIILNYNCEKELKPFEGCKRRFTETSFKSGEQEQFCENYQKLNCQAFYDHPYDYAPSCQKNPDRYYLLKKHNYQKALNHLYCAKKNNEAYCETSDILLLDYTYDISKVKETDIKEHCTSKSCRESLLERLEATLVEMSKHKLAYESTIKTYKKYIDYLSSEECLQQEI